MSVVIRTLRHSCKGLEQRFPKGGFRACAGAYPLAYRRLGYDWPVQPQPESRLRSASTMRTIGTDSAGPMWTSKPKGGS